MDQIPRAIFGIEPLVELGQSHSGVSGIAGDAVKVCGSFEFFADSGGVADGNRIADDEDAGKGGIVLTAHEGRVFPLFLFRGFAGSDDAGLGQEDWRKNEAEEVNQKGFHEQGRKATRRRR